ncbi:DUF5685 family protein [Streptomyces xanthii]|uniref:Cysteine-rich transmembrane CYSTM domain-containing protein n=1 Tax=Streptomyces xanthii TaxID=2768069 RepID=A0A7H1BEC9_9ACTN|nr:DUF5685 family protein [Streptomyces xanthii]QNS07084.1 hypothetical protein IAG42_28160 [Streptomyces xanthii]
MFGIVRPCSHRLGEGLKTQWMAHLCGLCLALRGDHGQFARIVTNYDGLLVSVLTEAQAERTQAGGWRRQAGPCPLRGMRTASVAQGEGARLAAAVSLVLASAKVRDHVDDRDGVFARRPVAAAARKVAASWGKAGARTGSDVGFDTAVLIDAVERQAGVESLAGPGTSVLTVTEPTETATAAAFAHTAVLAGRPHNAEPLAEAGRLFGRLAHLLDAVEDQGADAETGAWNPLTATGTPLPEARRLADDAVHGIRLALREVDFVDGRLAHLLLAHELGRSVDRAFGTTTCSTGHGHPQQPGPYGPAGHGSFTPDQAYGSNNPYGGGPQGPGGPYGPGGGGGGDGSGGFGGDPAKPPRPEKRGFFAGCFAAIGLCCTCKVCCADEYEGAWSRKKREGCCSNCDGSCCEACSCCQCCECLSCCDC